MFGYVFFRVPFTTADGKGTPLISLADGQFFGCVFRFSFFFFLAGGADGCISFFVQTHDLEMSGCNIVFFFFLMGRTMLRSCVME